MLQRLRSSIFNARPPKMDPLIAVVGATGTGKSKLAVDLAARYNGEIVNTDAMQMYRGLPIITNQIPVDERHGIPHHLIDCIDLDQEPWRVGIFKNEALRVIQEIRSRGKLPILVGGNHYYTSAVLFRDRLLGEGAEPSSDEEGAIGDFREEAGSDQWLILSASPEEMHAKLREVDPVMAERWHPNDSRKIRRSLEVYLQTGRPASKIYAEQKRWRETSIQGSGSDTYEPLRFRTLIFWVHSDKEALLGRLDKRVDAMIEQGLISEAKKMSDYVREKQLQDVTVDQRVGVWVSIGFKELAPYFSAIYEGSPSEDVLGKLRESCVESIKTATRQYAKYQMKYIRNSLCRSLEQVGRMQQLYVLDGTNVSDWNKCITEPSVRVVDSFFKDGLSPDPKSLSELARVTLEARETRSKEILEDMPVRMTCDLCKKTMMDKEQWDSHIHGNGHRRVLKTASKRAEREEYLRNRRLLTSSEVQSSEN